MLKKIMLSQDRKTAVLYFDNRPNFTLYHSEAQVLDLVAFFLLPVTGPSHYDITWANYVSSQEDTQSIDLSQIDIKQAA